MKKFTQWAFNDFIRTMTFGLVAMFILSMTYLIIIALKWEILFLLLIFCIMLLIGKIVVFILDKIRQ